MTSIIECDVESIVELTQKHWIVPGKKPMEIVEEDAHLLADALPLFRGLGLIGVPILGSGRRQWIVLYGASYVAIHKRIVRAVRLWNDEGVRWTNVALLASRRVLDPKKESADVLTKPVDGGLRFRPGWEPPAVLPTTEAELCPYILEQIGHHRMWDPSREHIVIAEDEAGKNAGTEGTLRAFVNQCDPRGESIVVVSSQPHIQRQGLMASRILGDRFEQIEATGYDTPAGIVNVTKTLHEIAQLLYDIHACAT